jgi:cobalamin synthase
MTPLREALLLRDLQDKWVLPRLLGAVAFLTARRAAAKSLSCLVRRPSRRLSEFFRALHEHPDRSEIALAALAVLIAFVRASAMLLLAIAGLILAVSRF